MKIHRIGLASVVLLAGTISWPISALPLYQSRIPEMGEKISEVPMLAQSTRRKRVNTEGSVRSKAGKTEIDLDEATLQGSARNPSLSAISSTKAETDYDFVKIRLRWHPEMIQSASSLDLRK